MGASDDDDDDDDDVARANVVRTRESGE